MSRSSMPAHQASAKSKGRILTLPPRAIEPAAGSVVAAQLARQQRRRASFLFPLSLIVIDALMIGVAFFMAFRLRLITDYIGPLSFTNYYPLLAIQMSVMITTYFFYQLYNRKRVMTAIDELGRVLAGTSVGNVITLAVASFFFKNQVEFNYPRLMIVYAWALTILFVTIGRYVHGQIQWSLKSAGIAREKVLVVGGGETAQVILNAIERMPGLGYEAIGVIPAGPVFQENQFSVPIVGYVEQLPTLIQRLGIDEVIIGIDDASNDEMVEIINLAQGAKVGVKVFPNLFQFMAGEMTIADLGGLPLLTVRDIALQGWKLTLKRLVDVVFGAMLLVLFSPLMLIIAILIKWESNGPVFFTQIRMGLDAKPFRMIKFRSMRQDAEKHSTWTVEGDPRVTRIGRFIRKTSLDEFPQFINVLLGEMSIVGPRPEQPQYVKEFQKNIPRYMDRHREKAGVTGWAQVNGLRGDTSIFERTKYDLWYIENWSLTLDFKIMIRTALKFLIDKSAY